LKKNRPIIRPVHTQNNNNPLEVVITDSKMVDIMKEIYDREEKLQQKNYKRLLSQIKNSCEPSDPS